jgi:hypothetical protein
MIAGDGKLRSEGGQVVIRMPVEIDITNADAIRDASRCRQPRFTDADHRYDVLRFGRSASNY